jgi:hypothetical protein
VDNKRVIDIDAFLAEQNKKAPKPYIIKMLGLELSIPENAPVHLMLYIKSLYADQDAETDLISEKDLFGSLIGEEQFNLLLNKGASYQDLLLILQMAYLHYQGNDPIEFIKENVKKELEKQELGKEQVPASISPGQRKKKKTQ